VASSYFSAPSDRLDPVLFDGDHLKDDVRTGLLNTLYSALENIVGLREPWNWAYAWLAGSAVSYQWQADRGNGDLDVLFGVDIPQFLTDNPSFPRLGIPATADYIDGLLKDQFWPKTAHYPIGRKKFEATFFWNAGTGIDISVIHPYAAYSLTRDEWDVRPPDLPSDPHVLYPKEWYDISDADYRQAVALEQLDAKGPSGKVSAYGGARTMWASIHGGRHAAFSDTGMGYSDIHNFRWQRAKETGTVEILRHLVSSADEHDATEQDRLYGTALEDPGKIITRAIMSYASPRYWRA